MQILSTVKATVLQKRRNLFGLGVTSLIAACGGVADEVYLSFGNIVNPGKAKVKLYTATIETDTDFTEDGATAALDVKVTKLDSTSVFLNFPTGSKARDNRANIHKLTADTNQYDLVVSTPAIGAGNKGGIFVFWNMADIQDETIGTGSSAQKRLEINGVKPKDVIGSHAPEFLQIGGVAGENKLDMVIRAEWVDFAGAGTLGNNSNEGAIYILWDVEDYKAATTSITFDGSGTNIDDSGLLTIKGGKPSNWIGIHEPEFLHIGGEVDNYDMIIRSDKVVNKSAVASGAIYILWDIDNYSGDKTAAITLNDNADGVKLNSGLLAIYGVNQDDIIGINPPEFLQIGGEVDNYDMVIRSHLVSNRKGAIYILWDVEDYAAAGVNKNKSIDLDPANLAGATSGLVSIYGRVADKFLGGDRKNILYNADSDGNKILTDIDGDGEKDISLRDEDYTYILFGNQVAETNNAGTVISKTIDLGNLTGLSGSDDGYFGYNFGNGNVGNVGYRFAGRKKDFDAVQAAYDALSSPLSDADADAGLWDIA